MPRPKHPVPLERIHLTIERDTLARLDLIISDPITGKPSLGARSQIVRLLLSASLDAFANGRSTISVTSVNRILASHLGGYGTT